MTTEIAIGAMENQLPEILDRVRQGEHFTITVDGQAVAELVPAKPCHSLEERAKAVEGLMNIPRIEGVSGDTVLEWIREGRR